MKNKLIAGLLTILGFSSCGGSGDDDGGTIEMYGIMRQSFVVKGKVEDAAEKPVEGIRIVLRPASEDMYRHFRNDTVYTASDGTFRTAPRPAEFEDGYSVTAVDVDGEKNGLFKPDETIFNFNKESSDYTYEDGAYLKQLLFVLKEDTETNESE